MQIKTLQRDYGNIYLQSLNTASLSEAYAFRWDGAGVIAIIFKPVTNLRDLNHEMIFNNTFNSFCRADFSVHGANIISQMVIFQIFPDYFLFL